MFHKKSTFPLVTILVLLMAGCDGGGQATPATPAPTSQPLTALLSELQGLVEVKNAGQADYDQATAEMILQVEGQVRTGEDGRVRLDLSTGSIIRVAPTTSFTLVYNDPVDDGLFTRIKIFTGRIWIALQGGSMEVETPSGLASVRGSYLSVWVDPETNDVWVSCLEGWCVAENPTEVLNLVAGQGAILYNYDPGSGTPPPPPFLRYLTQAEIDDFLANNPEAREVMDAVFATASALPTFTPTATGTPEPIATPEFRCFSLLSPQNGAQLGFVGPETFTWETQEGAVFYHLVFTHPESYPLSFILQQTFHVRYLESLPRGGTYTWEVTALDAAGEVICKAQPFTFTKAAFPTATPTNTPTATYTPAPYYTATPTFTPFGAGNTVFSSEMGPYGEIWKCYAEWYVIYVTDPEGISDAWIVYSAEPSGITGTHHLLSYYTDSWEDYFMIPSDVNDTVTYYFVIQDSAGNTERSPNTYQFIDKVGCGGE